MGVTDGGWCRFDLIYLVLDKAEEATDRKLARHLLSLHYERGQNAAQVRAALRPSLAAVVVLCTQASTFLRPSADDTSMMHSNGDEFYDLSMLGCRRPSPSTSCATS